MNGDSNRKSIGENHSSKVETEAEWVTVQNLGQPISIVTGKKISDEQSIENNQNVIIDSDIYSLQQRRSPNLVNIPIFIIAVFQKPHQQYQYSNSTLTQTLDQKIAGIQKSFNLLQLFTENTTQEELDFASFFCPFGCIFKQFSRKQLPKYVFNIL